MLKDSADEAPPANRLRGTTLCFLAQNLAVALAMGSFSSLVRSTEADFGISRTTAALGMSAMTIGVGAFAPFVGTLYQKLPMRLMMMSGAFMACLGYLGLAFAPNFSVALAMYVMIGTSFCILGVIGPVTFVNRWYETGRGRVLGFINLPLLFMGVPFLVGDMLRWAERAQVQQLFSVVMLLSTALLWFLPERAPPDLAVAKKPGRGATDVEPDVSRIGALLRIPAFWLISIGIGCLTGAGSAFLTHAVPFGIDKGLTLQTAAGLLSIYTLVGLLSPVVFGWLADRRGPPLVLIFLTLLQAATWISLAYATGLMLYVFAAIMGICMKPLVTLHGAAIAARFGASQVSKVLGASYIIKLPFIICSAPLIGYAFDLTGNYHQAFILMGAMIGLSSLLFLALACQTRVGVARSGEGSAVPTVVAE